MLKYYSAIIFLNIFAMAIIQLCICRSNTLSRKNKKIFLWLFNFIIVASFCEWTGYILQGTGSSTRLLHVFVKATELSLAPYIAVLVSVLIGNRNTKVISGILLCHVILEFLSGIYGFIYSVDSSSNYTHGNFYWIYITVYLISILYCLYSVSKNISRYQYNGIGFFAMIILFMLTGIAIQLVDSFVRVDYIAIGIASIMLYVFTLEMINQTDELTELLNRRGYENCISHISTPCMIIFLDVDDFKNINDTYGHMFGDRVLHETGITIRNSYARYGQCFRYGGDEFCVILRTRFNEVEKLNDLFQQEIVKEKQKESRFPFISIGYSFFDPSKESIYDAIRRSDDMMYRNKATQKQLSFHR